MAQALLSLTTLESVDAIPTRRPRMEDETGIIRYDEKNNVWSMERRKRKAHRCKLRSKLPFYSAFYQCQPSYGSFLTPEFSNGNTDQSCAWCAHGACAPLYIP